jgi:hypothetical protein
MTLYASDTIVWLPAYVAVGVVALSLIDKLNRLAEPLVSPFGRVPVVLAILTELAVCASMLTGVAAGAVILSLGAMFWCHRHPCSKAAVLMRAQRRSPATKTSEPT